jgi:outer membrane receptor protein involved in Fe transport
MPTAYRKHPLSFAIAMSLFAAVTTCAAADQPDTADAQTTATQSAPPDAPKTKKADDAEMLSVVEVVGVRASQERAIETKRMAQDIQDSITAESIGQLPDVTLTDALQRITGVQINRDAGTGTSVDVRGLPEVGTMLNGDTVPRRGRAEIAHRGDHRRRHQRRARSAHVSSVGSAERFHLQLFGERRARRHNG